MIYRRFQAQRQASPDKIAVSGAGTLTYAELAARAEAIAAGLRQCGVRPGDRVALLLDRSADTIAAMLGVLRAGAAYVPVDRAMPTPAIAALLADCQPRVIVTDRAMPALPAPLLRLGAAFDQAEIPDLPPADPDAAVAILYTSGSTGVPKGVVVPQRGIIRLVVDPDYVSLSAAEVLLHAAPLGFDASSFEIWGALLNGGRVAVLPAAVPSLDAIAAAIAEQGVTTAWLTSGLFHAMVDQRLPGLLPLRQLLTGGDVLSPPHVARALAALPDCRLINGYGPTENTTFTCCYTIPRDHQPDAPVPIGRAIRGTGVRILGPDGEALPPGAEGELVATGEGVALGYFNRPEQTAAVFGRFPDGTRFYRTGDRARLGPDGVVAFAGRADRQVKIRGKRVELDQVENALRAEPGVREAAIVMQGGRAVAYVSGAVDGQALRQALLKRLPEHEVPSRILVVDAMPLSRNGKLDRAALPPAPPQGAAAAVEAVWREILGQDALAVDANLFDLGASSLDVVRAHALLVEQGYALALVDFFAHPTIAALAAHIDGAAAPVAQRQAGPSTDAIAIIGMAGRFPGADDVPGFWRNLCDGVESIRHFRDDELEDAFPPAIRSDPAFVRARAVLDGIDQFDAAFFAMHPREAALTDPQQRVFLEIAWEALEAGGYDPAQYPGRIAVYAGSSPNSYLLRNVLPDRAAALRYTSEYQVSSYPTLLGAGADFVATRVSYKLDLRGPAFTVATACSTGLVAVAQACQALLLGQADMALAGGVSITLPQARGYLHEAGGMVSPDGHVRSFDAAAGGTVFGSGAAVVLLKRLADAQRDGDHVHAVIRGTAINNDGAGKVGFTAPSVTGQAACIAAAQAAAGVAPASIGYVECHGTATPLGDPIEFAGLARAFGPQSEAGFCVLGSVKSNVGHLDAAAGAVGLIKAALAVEHGLIPGTLHYRTPNPGIPLAGSPFAISAEPQAWAGTQPRRAGVSAFGVGGTNAHAVLEQAPADAPAPDTRTRHVLLLSARSPAALDRARSRLAAHITARPDQSLADIAYTLQVGRRGFAHRCALVCSDRADAAAGLGEARALTGSPAAGGGVAFLFPGQGAQYAEMGRALYDDEPVFRDAMDRCAAILLPLLGRDIRRVLYAGEAQGLADTLMAQPAIFSVEYATAQLWRAWGVQPSVMAGHSVGEFVAACLAGVFSLEDALRVIATRGRLLQEMAPGAMLAVRLSEAELLPLLGGELDLAAVNAPSLCVAAGPYGAVEALEAVLRDRGVVHRRLHTSHAFHSAMMDPAVDRLEAVVAQVSLSTPSIPFVSGVTGAWITAAEATSPGYWARHCRAPVRFAAGLESLLTHKPAALLECGPGRTLTTVSLQGAARGTGIAVVPCLPEADRDPDEHDTMAEALARLWLAGVSPDWRAVHRLPRRRVPLPATPFDRVRCWIDEPARPAAVEALPKMNQITPPASGIRSELIALFEELSGDGLGGVDPAVSFLELGFDSLFLGQVAQQVRARFGVAVTFRQLLGAFGSFGKLADHIAAEKPPAATAVAPLSQPALPMPLLPQPQVVAAGGGIEQVMREQLQAMSALMAQQLAVLGAAPAASVPAPAAPAPVVAPRPVENTARFDAFKPVQAGSGEPTPQQRAHIAELVRATTARTPTSKRMTQDARAYLADPRAAAGFRPEWKEMTYPIVAVRSQGARIWDADGVDYVDLVNGFGQTLFGHAPSFVVAAVQRQLERGFEIGPQAELAGSIAARFCAMTGNERMTFCNTGSEAVMAAMRIARTVTGRDRIVTFAGSYHGQFDEVLIKATPNATRPVAPGIPLGSVGNMVVLDYGSATAIAWIKAHADELAAVIVEPVQSRHPALQPVEFLKELRSITAASGTALVFDEVVTGFRMHPGGMQAVFGIRADLATYGKVIGGGLPVGILAGRAAFMDALDGGAWRYGDDSAPEAAVTFFAGTFVRHPLALAAVDAVLTHLDAEGPALQERMAAKTAGLVARMNDALAARGLPRCVETCGSLFYFKLTATEPLATLLYPHMRLRGVHIQEGFPCFLTTAHGPAEIAAIADAFEGALDALRSVGILGSAVSPEPVRDAPLTEAQMEVWLATQLGDAASCAFNEGITLDLRGPLDPAALQASLDRLVARHDALRARFTPVGDRMQIADTATMALTIEEQPTLDAVLEQEARTPFDLVAGPPIRARLVRLAAAHHALVLTAHHIVCDGWSINTLLTELATPGALPPALSFAAYARSQDAQSADDLAWWQQQFSTLPPPLDLPADHTRPGVKSFRGATRRMLVDAALMGRLKQMGAKHGCTLFATLLAAVQVLVGRLSQQDDLVVAVPAAAQSLLEGEVLVGHCANLLPIRAAWTGATPFATHLGAVRQAVLDAYEHQGCTLGTIVRALSVPRDTSRLPLTDVQFNLERLADGLAMPGLTLSCTANPKAFVNFDLFFNATESAAGIAIDCDYSTDLFDADTVDRWLGHLHTLLDAVAADPAQAVSALPLLSAEAMAALRDGGNDTAVPLPGGGVHSLIAEQAARTPGAVAVVSGAESLTYADLDARANQFAHYLAQRAQPGARVGVMLDRSTDMLVTLLATWKAGLSYVPLDPSHPAERLRHILADAGIAALISNDPDPTLVPSAAGINLDTARAAIAALPMTLPAIAADPERVAYVIYTSGSTGVPKGVAVQHRSLMNLLLSMQRAPGMTERDVLLAVTTIAFDIAGLELFLPLITGARVVIAAWEDVADGHRLAALVQSAGVTVLQATPATWRLLLEASFAPGPLRMLCGGEALPRALANALLQAGTGELWNLYGPTETTIWSAAGRVLPGNGPVTIGAPIANTTLHVLDAADRLAPLGVPGQLHIGGAGVAVGYLNRPDLTAERFIPDPFNPGGRLYRTGDSARRLPDGRIEVLGRLDNQVKLRGYRLEPGEVEHAVMQTGRARAAVVALRDGPAGVKQLVAWFVPADPADPGVDTLRRALQAALPGYMVPSQFVPMAALPLTPNGKVDQRALPDPSLAVAAVAAPVAEQPLTPLERSLLSIWAEVLGQPQIGRDDDLLTLGADSIQLFQITARANRQDVPLLAKHLLMHRTVAKVAAALEGAAPAKRSSAPSLQQFRRDRRSAIGG